jgi:uncharacterized membrane protein
MHKGIVGLFVIVIFVVLAVVVTLLPLLLRSSAGKTVRKVGSFQSIKSNIVFLGSSPKRMSTISVEEAFGNDTQHLKRIDAEPDTVFRVLEGLADEKDVFIVAKAAWCPDCQAVPSMVTGLKSFATEKQSLLTVVLLDVGSRELWKSGTHPLKSNTGDAPSLRLAGVPMLIHWADGTEKGRLTAGLTDGAAMQQGEAVVTKTVTDWLRTL